MPHTVTRQTSTGSQHIRDIRHRRRQGAGYRAQIILHLSSTLALLYVTHWCWFLGSSSHLIGSSLL